MVEYAAEYCLSGQYEHDTLDIIQYIKSKLNKYQPPVHDVTHFDEIKSAPKQCVRGGFNLAFVKHL